MPKGPQPGDLVVGPLNITSGKVLATLTPAEHGYFPYGPGGASYKIALVVRPGSVVTVTIATPARGHAVLAARDGAGGVTSATFRSCPHAAGFFAQSFAFTHPPIRGCVPLEVTIGNRPPVRHVTLSLFAGPCSQ